MRALSIFIYLTSSADEIDKQSNVNWLDGPMSGYREPPRRRMPKHDVAGPVVMVIDLEGARNNL